VPTQVFADDALVWLDGSLATHGAGDGSAGTGCATLGNDGGASVVTSADRLVLSALADRLIFGHPDTFSIDDANELTRLLPDLRRWHGFITDWLPGFSGRLELPGNSSAGVAAGVGQVSIRDEGRSFEYDSAGRRIVRAGQWKLHRRGHAIQIAQVMSDDMDEGRTAMLAFFPGKPMALLLLAQVTLSIGPVHIGLARFRPWKVPA